MSYDVVVIGAGPAGVQLGYYLEKEARSGNLTYTLIEKSQRPGSFFEVYPRSNVLISINKVYTGTDDREFNFRHDWNSLLFEEDDPELFFKHYTEDLFPQREVLTKYMQVFTQKTGVKVQYETTIAKISKGEDGRFTLTDTNGNVISAKYVFVATGTVAPYIPAIPGIEHCWKYSENFPQNKEHWRNKRVLILGKGNSAFETADQLSPWCSTIHLASPNPVSLAWDTHFVGNLRAVNNGYLDFYQLKSQHGMINGRIQAFKWKEIDENGIGKGVSVQYDFTISPEDPVVEFHYDEVILCTGWLYFDPNLFDESIQVKTCHNGKFTDVSPIWESTSQPNLFFSGAAMGGRGYKRNTTGFIHGFRYCVRSQLNAVLHREFKKPFPTDKITNNVDDIAKFIVHRVNRNAAGYQMFAVLVDLLLLQKKNETPKSELDFIYEVHTDHARDLYKDTPYIEVMLQYGDRGGTSAFSFEQQSTPSKPELSWALHPCLRLYYNGKVISRLHMLETAELNWDIPKYHVEPLKAWLNQALAMVNQTDDLDSIPALKMEMPLSKTTIVYRGPDGEEHKTKTGIEKVMNY